MFIIEINSIEVFVISDKFYIMKCLIYIKYSYWNKIYDVSNNVVSIRNNVWKRDFISKFLYIDMKFIYLI